MPANQAAARAAQPGQVRVQTLFTYPVKYLGLAPGDTQSATLPIDSATDFLWFKGSYFADVNGSAGGQTNASRIVPSVDVQIQVTGADRNLMNDYVPIPALFGEQGVPFVSPAPMVFLANSNVKFTFVSRETSRTLDIYLSLIGLKDYGVLQAAAAA